MQRHDDCVAVFDVGKTNKKFLIYSMDFQIADSVYIQLEADQREAELHEHHAEACERLFSQNEIITNLSSRILKRI
jgi:hypothetical protein